MQRFNLLLLLGDSFLEREGLMGQLFHLCQFQLNFLISLVELILGHLKVNLKLLDLTASLL